MTSTGDLPGPAQSQLDPVVLDGWWDFDDPALSERRFRDALAGAPAGGSTRAELTTQLARVVGMQGRFDEANSMLDGIDDGVAVVPVVHIRLALERGRLLNSSGDPVGAIEQFLDALVRTNHLGHRYTLNRAYRAPPWPAERPIRGSRGTSGRFQ